MTRGIRAAAATTSRKQAELVVLLWLWSTSNSSDGRWLNKGASLRRRDLWAVRSIEAVTMFGGVLVDIAIAIAIATPIGVMGSESLYLIDVETYQAHCT